MTAFSIQPRFISPSKRKERCLCVSLVLDSRPSSRVGNSSPRAMTGNQVLFAGEVKA